MGVWVLQLETLAKAIPVVFAMQFNTALCFALTGIAFIATFLKQSAAARSLIAVAGFLSGLTLIEYFLGTSFGIDTLLLDPFVTIGASEPGRMSPNTAICFVIVAIGLSLPHSDGTSFVNQASKALGFLTIFIATLTEISYVIRVEAVLEWVDLARMSPLTAAGFVNLGFGLIYIGSNNGHIYLSLLIAFLLLFLFFIFILDNRYLSGNGVTYLFLDEDTPETQQRLSVIITATILLYLGLTFFAFWNNRRSLNALVKSEAQLASIIEQAADGIILIDNQGTIVAANRACERMFGFNQDEMIGQRAQELMPANLSENNERHFWQTEGDADTKIISKNQELEGKHKDGTTFPIELSISRIDAFNPVIYSGIVRDISERKKTESALLAANAELEEFAYRTSHDLRSPVSSAIGLIRICEAQLQESDLPALEANLSRLHLSFLRLDNLIGNIIEVTRSHLMVEAPTRFHVRKVIEDVLQELVHIDGYSDMTFHIEIDPKLATVSSATKFEMIIRNLLSNAIKYRDKGVDTSELRMSASRKTDRLQLIFSDNGIGIPPESRSKMFEMFRRFHPKVAQGSGLGMYIMKKCAEVLGGTIVYEPQPKGSRFILELTNGGDHVSTDNSAC